MKFLNEEPFPTGNQMFWLELPTWKTSAFTIYCGLLFMDSWAQLRQTHRTFTLLAGLLMLRWVPPWGTCQDNLLNLPLPSWHLPYQYYYLWPISLVVAAAEDREPLYSPFLDLGALGTRKGDSSLCVFSSYGHSLSWSCGECPWHPLTPAALRMLGATA